MLFFLLFVLKVLTLLVLILENIELELKLYNVLKSSSLIHVSTAFFR